jgi:hypothetical protein
MALLCRSWTEEIVHVDCIEEKHSLCWSAILLCCYNGEVIRDGVFFRRETEYGIKDDDRCIVCCLLACLACLVVALSKTRIEGLK